MKGDIQLRRLSSGEEYLSGLEGLIRQLYDPATRPTHRVGKKYFTAGLLAERSGKPVGGLCIYHNPFIRHRERKTLLFGNFESENDDATAAALIHEAASMARAEGAAFLAGPVNGSTWNDYRFTIGDHQRAFFSEQVHRTYYPVLLLKQGFKIVQRYVSCVADAKAIEPDQALLKKITAMGLRIRRLEMNRFESELSEVFQLCSLAFAENVFFSPVDQNEFIEKYLQARTIIDPEFVLLAEDRQGLKAFVFCFPDPCAVEKTLVVKTVAKAPDAPAGLVTLMVQQIYSLAFEKAYKKLLHVYMHEKNRSVQLSKKFGGKVFKEHAIFIREV